MAVYYFVIVNYDLKNSAIRLYNTQNENKKKCMTYKKTIRN